MLNAYDKATHMTLDDIAAMYAPKKKPELQAALNTLGINHVDTYRAPDKKIGRPNNLYIRKQVEQAMRHIAAFKLED